MSITHKYTLFALSVTVALGWAVSIPYIANYMSLHLGFDPLELIGSGGVLGPKKIKALEYLILISAILVVVGYALTLNRSGRFARLVVLIVVTPLIFATNSWLDVVPLGHAQERIQVTRLPTVNYDAIFNDTSIKRDEITSYAEFISAVDINFNKHRNTLQVIWKINDENLLKTLFYLNTVANLFSFGNSDPNALGGCAVLNEQFGDEARDRNSLGVRFYLDSKIGCCSDYAIMTKVLLDNAGIENNLVAIMTHGHVFNEVLLDDKWHTMDANIGAFYDRTWNAIVDEQGPFSVTVFPVLSISGAQSSRYRPILAQFRHKTFMVAATGAEHTTNRNSSALASNGI